MKWVELSPPQCREKVGHALRDTAKTACKKRNSLTRLDESPLSVEKRVDDNFCSTNHHLYPSLPDYPYDSTPMNTPCTINNEINFEEMATAKAQSTRLNMYEDFGLPSNRSSTLPSYSNMGIEGNSNTLYSSHSTTVSKNPPPTEKNYNPLECVLMGQQQQDVTGCMQNSSNYLSSTSTNFHHMNETSINVPSGKSLHDMDTEYYAGHQISNTKHSEFTDADDSDEFLTAIASALAPILSSKNTVSNMFDTLYASMGSLQMSNSEFNFDCKQQQQREPETGIETMNASMMSLCVSLDSQGSPVLTSDTSVH